MKYRKKPVVVEAFRWSGWGDLEKQPDWFADAVQDSRIECHRPKRGWPWLQIETPEGAHKAREGDWIIRGIKGELYPCRNDIFAATYEPVE